MFIIFVIDIVVLLSLSLSRTLCIKLSIKPSLFFLLLPDREYKVFIIFVTDIVGCYPARSVVC